MGDKEGGGEEFGIPLRPPACLAVLDSAKDELEREAALESLRVEAREVQCRSKEQLVQFRTEMDIFLRLMYKNKNQHRHSVYYRRLSQVKRDLRLLDYASLDKAVECFTRWTFPFKQSRVNMDQSNADSDQLHSTLCILVSATRILNQIDRPILSASIKILGLLSQSFFMPLGLTIFSTLARLRVLSQQLLFELAAIYNLLFVLSKQALGFPSSRTQVLVEASRLRLPLHLECHWEGGKLCMMETQPPPEDLGNRTEVRETVPLTTPLSSGLWFVDDRKSLGVSKKIISGVPITGAKVSSSRDLWFANDTTGVKYDVCVSGVTSREEPMEIPVSTGTATSSLLNESRGVPSVSQAFKDESELKFLVSEELSEGRGDVGFREKDEDRESTDVLVSEELSEGRGDAGFHAKDEDKESTYMLDRVANMSESYLAIHFARTTPTFPGAASSGEKILSSGTAVESGLQFTEGKDVKNQCSVSAKVAKRAVAYVSVRPPSETRVKTSEDGIRKGKAIEPGVSALERLVGVPPTKVENRALQSTKSACGEDSSKDRSHQASKETSVHTTGQPGASSEEGQWLSNRASVSSSALTSGEDKQNILPGSSTGIKRPVSYISVQPESCVQKRMKGDCTSEVIPISGSAGFELSVTPFSAAVEKDSYDILPFVSVEATSENLLSLEVVEDPKDRPLEATATDEALRTLKSEFDIDITPPEEGEERKAVQGFVPGTLRHAAETSGTETIMMRMENSGNELLVPDKKLADSKERVDKTRKKKRLKSNESAKARQLDSKQESSKRKRTLNQKVTKKKQVSDLFSMLLGG